MPSAPDIVGRRPRAHAAADTVSRHHRRVAGRRSRRRPAAWLAPSPGPQPRFLPPRRPRRRAHCPAGPAILDGRPHDRRPAALAPPRYTRYGDFVEYLTVVLRYHKRLANATRVGKQARG